MYLTHRILYSVVILLRIGHNHVKGSFLTVLLNTGFSFHTSFWKEFI